MSSIFGRSRVEVAWPKIRQFDAVFGTVMAVPKKEDYTCYLKNKETGEEVDLGQSGELKTDVAKAHQINIEDWNQHWEFCCRRVRWKTHKRKTRHLHQQLHQQ